MPVAADIDNPRRTFGGITSACGSTELWKEQVSKQERPEVIGEKCQVNHRVSWGFDLVSLHVTDTGVVDKD